MRIEYRFPRLKRFPRFLSRKKRNKEGTLLCICRKPMKIYSATSRRGFCCWEHLELYQMFNGPYIGQARR